MSMLRPLITCSRLILESPLLMLLGLVVVVVPGGLLLMPVFASKMRRAKASVAPHSNRPRVDAGTVPYLAGRRAEGELF